MRRLASHAHSVYDEIGEASSCLHPSSGLPGSSHDQRKTAFLMGRAGRYFDLGAHRYYTALPVRNRLVRHRLRWAGATALTAALTAGLVLALGACLAAAGTSLNIDPVTGVDARVCHLVFAQNSAYLIVMRCAEFWAKIGTSHSNLARNTDLTYGSVIFPAGCWKPLTSRV
jgi:hypothetical protein